MFKNMRLSTKLISLLLLVGLVPTIGISLFSYLNASQALNEAIFKEGFIFADQTAGILEDYFLERQGDVKVVADKVNIKKILEKEKSQYTFNAENPFDLKSFTQEVEEDLKLIADAYGYLSIAVVNMDGIVIADSTKKHNGKSVLNYNYIKHKALKGEFGTSKMHNSDILGEIVISVGGPVYDDSKNVIGAVSCILPQKTIAHKAQFGVEKLGESGDAYLINSDQLLLTDTRLGNKNEALKKHVKTKGTNKAVEFISRKDTDSTFQGIYPDYRGEMVMGITQVIKVGDNYDALLVEVDEAEALAAVFTMRNIAITVTLVASALIVLLGIFFSRSITKPINKIITSLNESSEQVASASSQVAEASQKLAEGSSEQASSLEETSASLEEMSSTIERNTSNTMEANGMVEQTNQIVLRANESMKTLKESMAAVNVSSEKTGKIIKAIDEIAFQTNLLSLNAAVEAARAGEAGMGFAVVADEVRNLAQRSAESAKETAEMIDSSIKGIKEGYTLTETTEKDFNEVVDVIHKLKELVAEVANASKEQSQGIQQITSAVADMDKVTQGSAASSEESASASEEMSAQAQSMREVVHQLALIVGGSNVKRNGFTKSNGNGRKSEAHHVLSQETFDRLDHNKKPQKVAKKDKPGKVKVKDDDPKKIMPFDEDEHISDKDFKDFK